jgi:hypothetical protein
MSSNFPPAPKCSAIVANVTADVHTLVPKHRRIGRRAATIEVGLTPSGLGDLFRDFDEIFSDYITLIADR